jgi:hypothetical protein
VKDKGWIMAVFIFMMLLSVAQNFTNFGIGLAPRLKKTAFDFGMHVVYLS